MWTVTEKDFEQLSWHDNSVHGLSFRAGEHGSGQLLLDLDFILEWLTGPDGSFRFLVSPATLTFNGVSDLKVSLDFASIAMGPFTIGGIERAPVTYPNGFNTYQWRIRVVFPPGGIQFVATGFEQTLRAAPINVETQDLTWERSGKLQ